MKFVHLHVHTEYSLLDGAARIGNLIQRAKDLNMPAIAITDHGAMFGAIDFYKEAKKAGIKPIIGCEVYTAPRTMTDKDPEKDKYAGHLILLAESNEGYQNLIKIVSKAYTDGFYYKPRVDTDLLKQYSKGIICLSACLAGDVQKFLLNRHYEERKKTAYEESSGLGQGVSPESYEKAKEKALEFQSIFGKGNFFLEIQDQGLEEEHKINPYIKQLSQETGIPLVATNDVHYVHQEDAEFHDVLLCIQTLKTVDDVDRMSFPNNEFYLKSYDEMHGLFSDIPEALENAVAIAERCQVEFDFDTIHLPSFVAPEGITNKDYLRKLCYEGLKKRYGTLDQVLEDRLAYELDTIESMGYVEYFLIVWDFIDYAKRHKIEVGPGRGSAAGSIVAYALAITDVDPIKYGLIFERFLNPERISMPDIDIDFCYERRQEVIDYVVEKYGQEKVAQIITFGTMKAKGAVRDVGRALSVSYGEVDAIAKKIPFALNMTIDLALKQNQDLQLEYETNPQTKKIIDIAKQLEGMPRHASTHAAGVVIAKKAIDDYVPLYVQDKGITTQYTMGTLEELGLLKMDFLGLKTLTVIRNALTLIEEDHNKMIDFSTMAYDDPKIYDLISSGNTFGIFQLESGGMRRFLKNLKPDCFEDIIAGISLYRPGPMDSIPTYIKNKKNPEGISYLHESLKPILDVTYGCMVYQEQVMEIVRRLAGYNYGRSDLMRRAMSKKKVGAMNEERLYFIHGKEDAQGNIEIPGCIRNGIPEAIASQIFDQMAKFAEYAFNKSHAAAYAVIAYQTAYLKAYYPIEFMAATMTNVMGDSRQMAKYLRNAFEMGIRVLPPHINHSKLKFSVEGKDIRFGLFGVKNVGENLIEHLVQVRNEKGPFVDLFDFLDRMDSTLINKRAVESLIKAGALDGLKGSRLEMLAVYEDAISTRHNEAKKNDINQISLFKDFGETINLKSQNAMPALGEYPKERLLSIEKEMVGLYLSGHPLEDYEATIKKVASHTTEDIISGEELGEIKDGEKVKMAGIITAVKIKITKNNDKMAFVTLEDLFGTIEIIVFPKNYRPNAEHIVEDGIIGIMGRVTLREDEDPTIIAENIMPLEHLATFAANQEKERFFEGKREDDSPMAEGSFPNQNRSRQKAKAERLNLAIDLGEKLEDYIDEIKEILSQHKGTSKVVIYDKNTKQKFVTESEYWVTLSEGLRQDLKALLGENNVI